MMFMYPVGRMPSFQLCVIGTALLLMTTMGYAVDVPLYRVFEEEVINNNSYGNKYVDVELDVVYNHPGTGTTISFYGFYDGWGNGSGNPAQGNVWKMRFMPTEPGQWNYTYTWSDSTPGGSGSFNCVTAGAGKGVLRPYTGNTNWFAYEGEEPVLWKSFYLKTHGHLTQDLNWIIDNIYMKLINRGYNHFQMASMLPISYWDQVLADGPPGIIEPLFRNDPRSNMRLDIWKRVDEHILWLNNQDIYLHCFEGFEAKHWYPFQFVGMSDAEQRFYVKYVCSRLAPCANIAGWNFTYEIGANQHTAKLADLLIEYDPWDHPRTFMTAAETPTTWDPHWHESRYNFVANEPSIPHNRNGCQMSFDYTYSMMRGATDMFDKPVFNTECWGLWRSCYGACNPSIRANTWANTMAAAYATWDCFHTCDTGNVSTDIFDPNYEEGALAVDVMFHVMTDYVKIGPMLPYDGVSGGKALAEPGRQYVVYKPGGGSFGLDVHNGEYQGIWINAKTGAEQAPFTVNAGGGWMTFNSPYGGDDVAFVLTRPSVVSNLEATAISQTEIDLSWELIPGLGAQNYRIERKAAGGSYSQIALVGSSETSYSDTGLEAGTTYCYQLRADLGGGNLTDPSDEQCATTFDTPPADPTNLACQASQAILQVDLTWSDNSDNEEGFAIERSKADALHFVEIGRTSSSVESYLDYTGLEATTLYYYRVRAFNSGGGQYSGYSSTCSCLTPCIIDPITIDDNEIPPVSYSDNWTLQNWPGRYMNTTHESETYGAYVELPFTGETISIYGDKRAYAGTATVRIDGAVAGTLVYNDGSGDGLLIGTFDNLSCEPHTIRITVDGNGWIYMDKFVYTPCCIPLCDQPPYDPSDLSINVDDCQSMTLSWLDNGSPDVNPACDESSFLIERSADGGLFEQIGSVPGVPGSGNVVQYTDAGLRHGVQYCYRVSAVNSFGPSGVAELCASIAMPCPPAPPTGLAAQAGNGRVTLSWNANTETDPAVLYYMLYRSTTEGGPYGIVAVSFGGTNISDSQVFNGTTYYYRLAAVDTWPQTSGQSEEVSATPREPSPPTESPVLSATGGVSMVTLDWTDSNDNEDGFVIERKLDTETEFVELTTVGLVSQYVDAGLSADTTYDYRIYAYNADGSGPMSQVASATTEACTPTDEMVDDANGMINYNGTWSDQSGWTGRYMETLHETETNGAYAELIINGDSVELIGDVQPWGGNAEILIDGVSQGMISFNGATDYQQVVYSKSELGAGDHTFRVVCRGGGWTYVDAIHYFGCPLPPTPPAAPTNLTATATSCSQIRLNWVDQATNEHGFKVERKTASGSYTEVAVISQPDIQTLLDGGLAELTEYTYRVRSYNVFDSGYSNEASETTTDCGQPPQFQTVNITSGYGSITPADNGYDLVLSGVEIGAHAGSDSCFFAYQSITGDFDVAVQVVHQTWPVGGFEGEWTKAGIMARWSQSSDDLFVATFGRGKDNGDWPPQGFVEWRWNIGGNVENGGAQAHSLNTSPPTEIPNEWLRLKRVGKEFFGYISDDGSNWQLIKHILTEYQGKDVPDTLMVGFTGTSKDLGRTIELNVRNLSGFNQ